MQKYALIPLSSAHACALVKALAEMKQHQC